MSEHNDDRTRTFGARAPSVTPTVVHVAEIREWRQKHEQKHEQNYNKLVTFVRQLSCASAYEHNGHEFIDARWQQDAEDLLQRIAGNTH